MEQAAREAGARRLRPIFLTSMAAAMGMVPMILSGSRPLEPAGKRYVIRPHFLDVFHASGHSRPLHRSQIKNGQVCRSYPPDYRMLRAFWGRTGFSGNV